MMAAFCPTLENDLGVPEIGIGSREFSCIGASPPQDHPKVYLNMNGQGTALCPYCATRYRYDPQLAQFDSEDR